jgi:hypothetical protein
MRQGFVSTELKDAHSNKNETKKRTGPKTPIMPHSRDQTLEAVMRRIATFKVVDEDALAENTIPDLISDTGSEPPDVHDEPPSPSFVRSLYYARPMNDDGEIVGSPSNTTDNGADDENESLPMYPPWGRASRIRMDGVKLVGREGNEEHLAWMAVSLISHYVAIRRNESGHDCSTYPRRTGTDCICQSRYKVIWNLCQISEVHIREDFLRIYDPNDEDLDHEDIWTDCPVKFFFIAIETLGRTFAQFVEYIWDNSSAAVYTSLEDIVVELSEQHQKDPRDIKPIYDFFIELAKFVHGLSLAIDKEDSASESDSVTTEPLMKYIGELEGFGETYGLND